MPLRMDTADSFSSRFSSRLSRRLCVASALVILAVFAGGGLSVFLATKISHTNTLVRQEYTHALAIEQLHLSFHAMITAIEQLEATGDTEDLQHLPALQQRLGGQLKSVMEQQKAEPVPTDLALENTLLAELQRLVGDLQQITDRVVSGADGIPFLANELIRLESLSERGAMVATHLVDVHQRGVGQLLTIGQKRMRLIIVLYLALFGAGAVAVAVAGLVGNRVVAAPLQRLAQAARSVAEGRLDVRVPVAARDEIGQLSHTFNIMAERLEAREGQLALTHDQLRRKISEAHALYQIGGEISRLTQVEPTLRWAVTKARELLDADVAMLSVLSPDASALVVRAHSDPQARFLATGGPPLRVSLVGPKADLYAAALEILEPASVQAYLTVPLRRADTVIGVLVVASTAPREFSSDEHDLVAGLAAHAALVIDNARLYEEVQGVAVVAERRRLSREIHDGLAQTLGLLFLKIRSLQDRLTKADSVAAATTAVKELAALAESAYEESRQSIVGLRAMASRSTEFVQMLSEFVHEFRALNGVSVALDANGSCPITVPPRVEIQVTRIIQEALHNVRRHAEAKCAWVRVRKDSDSLSVTVEDDGRGWDLGSGPARAGQHFGLQTMQERVESLGGTLLIDTAPGRGTRVTATMPLEPTQ